MTTNLEFRNILLCTDYSRDADAAFIHAFDQAKKYGSTLHILNVIPTLNPCNVKIFGEDLSMKKTMEKSHELDEQNRLQALGALKKTYRERCEDQVDYVIDVRLGSPDIEIIKYSEENNVAMIILGTVGRDENKRFAYIKTAANVSKYANCQVITIGRPGK
jgi:nucleotide-binding universal stress UspA family protein